MKYKLYIWEWDVLNGEYLYRDYEGVEIEVESEEELWKEIKKRLEEVARRSKPEWECWFTPDLELLCERCDVKVGGRYCVKRLVGYDFERLD